MIIGPKELEGIAEKMGIKKPSEIGPPPKIQFPKSVLEKTEKTHILILGIPLSFKGKPYSINQMREIFGINPKKQPCFYNQDWYLKEEFARAKTLEYKWYLISKEINPKTRGLEPEQIKKNLSGMKFPQAVLTTYTFFAYYLITRGKKLWEHDFIWCSDLDSNGDRIYVGRYTDPFGKNKNGFEIHRHLKIKENYGAVK